MKNLIVGPLSPFQAASIGKELEKRKVPFDWIHKTEDEMKADRELFGMDIPSDSVFFKLHREDLRENRSLFQGIEIHLPSRLQHPMEFEDYEPTAEKKRPPLRSQMMEISWRMFLAIYMTVVTISLYKNPSFSDFIWYALLGVSLVYSYLRKASPF